MHNNLLQVKFKERLNKLASLDYDNLECWQITEAFNKAQIEWVRRQVHGNNIRKEGDESSKVLFDDLQLLITNTPLKGKQENHYFETLPVPANYLYYKRLNVTATSTCCPSRNMNVYLAEQSDINNLISDELRKPSFEWAETFAAVGSNRYYIYTNDAFHVESVTLTYYRKPLPISFEGCVDIETNRPTINRNCEFKDDIAEIIIDEAVAILAGDIENFNQVSRIKSNVQTNY